MRQFAKNIIRAIWKNRLSFIGATLITALGVMLYIGFSDYTTNFRNVMDHFFSSNEFADVFARVEAVPEADLPLLTRIEGIEQVFGRLTQDARLLREDADNMLTLHLMSYDEGDALNRIVLEESRFSGQDGVLYLSRSMAEMYGYMPGDLLTIQTGGGSYSFTYAGYAQSPEYLYYVPADSIQAPNHSLYAIAAVKKEELQRITGKGQVANELGFRLRDGYTFSDVEKELKEALSPYGLYEVCPKEKQAFYKMIADEIDQYETMAIGISVIFLQVSAFLLYIIIRKLVDGDRTVIGTMKAMGASDAELFLVYMAQSLLIGFLGGGIAVLTASLIGKYLFEDSMNYYSMLGENYVSYAGTRLTGLAFAVLASVFSTFIGIRDVLKISPSESMRAAAPASGATVELPGCVLRHLNMQQAIALRNLFRNLFRSLVIAFAVAFPLCTIAVTYSANSIMKDQSTGQLDMIETYDLLVGLSDYEPIQKAIDSMPFDYLLRCEGKTTYDMEFESDSASGFFTLTGLMPDSELYNVMDNEYVKQELPGEGLLLSAQAANMLQVSAGDILRLKNTMLSREPVSVPVAAVMPEPYGKDIFIDLNLMEKYFDIEPCVNSLMCTVQDGHKQDVIDILKRAGNVSYIMDTEEMYDAYYELTAQFVTLINVVIIFSFLTGAVVIYSIISISIRERKTEFGTFMVLGMRGLEIAEMVSFEQVICFAAGLVMAVPMSFGLKAFYEYAINTGEYMVKMQVPFYCYIAAFIICVMIAAFSVMMVLRDIRRIELTDVLKERS